MYKKSLIKNVFVLVIAFMVLGCTNRGSNESNLTKGLNFIQGEISIVDFNELESSLYIESEKTQIVNFWAMWCIPCVKELPYLEEYAKTNPDIDLLLVSLDFPEDIETKLKPFLKERGITSNVVLLDDSDANSWINKIDRNWSGAIPFTILFNNKHRVFYERPFESIEDLDEEIDKII